MPQLANLVRRLRPAPLASAVGYVCGLHKRRILQTDQGKFSINPMSLFGHVLANSEYEPMMIPVLRRYLKPGSVFIDLGANEGYFSVIASKLVGPRGTVIAVEPQTRQQSVLGTNFALNNCYNIRIVKAAVSSKTQTAQLQLTAETNTGGSSLYRHTKYPLRSEEVDTFTLAELIDRIGVASCDLMKVDIEGAEYDAFMPAEDIMRTGIIQNIVLEIHNSILAERGLSGNALHETILGFGYTLNEELGPWVYTFAGRRP